MAYSDFTLAKVKSTFQLTIDEKQDLFAEVAEIKPSDFLSTALVEYVPLATAIGTEKARSEFIIAQVLSEVRRQLAYQIALFSGSEFNVEPEKGLTGYCDFLFSGIPEQLYISAPVVVVVEAKKEDIVGGLGQCIASMVAAQLFNQREERAIAKIYGAVTSGTVWRFVTLEKDLVCIDRVEHYISEIGKILGILCSAF